MSGVNGLLYECSFDTMNVYFDLQKDKLIIQCKFMKQVINNPIFNDILTKLDAKRLVDN